MTHLTSPLSTVFAALTKLLLGLAVLLVCSFAAISDPARADAAGDPTSVIERLHTELLAVMKDAKKLGYEGRYRRLEPILKELFDLRFMAEKSVGRYWASAGRQEQEQLVETFIRFTIANYAGRFEGWSGQSFATVGKEPSTHGTVLVRSRLDEPDDDGVQLDYRLRKTDGGWRIVDVYLNGTVSELALRRSEYSSLIKREGFQALLAKLDERIDSLAEGSATSDQS